MEIEFISPALQKAIDTRKAVRDDLDSRVKRQAADAAEAELSEEDRSLYHRWAVSSLDDEGRAEVEAVIGRPLSVGSGS